MRRFAVTCSEPQEIFDPQGSLVILNPDHSLTAQQVAGNAIALGFKDLVRTCTVMLVTEMASRA